MTEATQNTQATQTATITAEEAKGGRRIYGRPYFQRRKSCPFSRNNAPAIDYKDTRLLGRFVSEYGKIIPSHVTGVSAKNQRKLATAVKRARQLALLPYTSNGQNNR